jgi:hypothetical protein
MNNSNSPWLLMGMQNGTATLEYSLAVSYKGKQVSPYNLVIALLDVYPMELKPYVHTKSAHECL